MNTINHKIPLVFVCPILVISGCAEVSYPQQSDVSDARSARTYLASSRSNLLDQRHLLQAEESAVNFGIAGGAVSAVLGGALHWSSKTVIQSTILSGTSLAIGQTLQPRTQIQIVDSGLTAINCVDSKAELAYPQAAEISIILKPTKDLKSEFNSEVETQTTVTGNPIGPADVALLQDAIVTADQFIFANQSTVFQQVRLAADAITTSVNTQLNNTVADPAAIQKAFAGVTATASSPPAGGAAPAVQAPAAGGGGGAAREGAPVDPAHAEVAVQIQKLNVVLDTAKREINALPPFATTVNFAACVPGAIVLTLSPGTPVVLNTPNQSYTETVTGGSATWNWDGKVPPDVTVAWGNSSTGYVLTVKSTITAPDTYVLGFVPVGGGPEQKLSVTVQSPPAH